MQPISTTRKLRIVEERKQRITAPPVIQELRLDELMAKAGIKSYQELADKMGIERASLSRSLNASPTYSMLYRIAEALGVNVHELFKSSVQDTSVQGIIKVEGKPYIIDNYADFKTVAEVVETALRSGRRES